MNRASFVGAAGKIRRARTFLRKILLTSRCALAMAAVLIAACAAPPAPTIPGDKASLGGIDERYYDGAAARGVDIFRVDPQHSLVVIEVYRAGPLARLGHDHVVASHDVGGLLAPREGRSDLVVPLQHLVVDEPDLRAEAGFDTRPSPDDIEATRRNMLGKVLHAEAHPLALVRVARFSTDGHASATVTVNGVTREVDVPVALEATRNEIDASGRFTLRQSDFDIVPLSVLGGAVRVRDEIAIRFHIRARRIAAEAG